MEIVAWVVLAIIILIILGLTYYLAVGALLYKLIFARRNIASRILTKDFKERMVAYKIDLCWWDEVNFSTVKIQSTDGLTLVGHLHEANSHKTAIVFHGFGGSYREVQQYCKFFHEKNFSVLAVDLRSHGDSDGNCIGYGWLEKDDLALWVKFVNDRRPDDKIVLFGLSMGGATVCMAAGQELHNVEAIISDCAFASAKGQFEHILRDHKILMKVIEKHAFSYAKRVAGFDVTHADAVPQVKKTKVPILYIHGAKDNFVSFENLEILYEATPPDKREKFIVEDAAHALSYPVAGVMYEKKISAFLSKKTTLK